MDVFRVRIRRLRSGCRVRVDGVQNARWLLAQLSQSFVFKSSQPIDDDVAGSCSTFHVLYSSQVSPGKFESLLSRIPQVQLIPDPA